MQERTPPSKMYHLRQMEDQIIGRGSPFAEPLITAAALTVAFITSANAQEYAAPTVTATPPSSEAPVIDFFTHWFDRVDAARETQPHWVPPLVTLSPLITELLKEDGYYQRLGNGADILNLGGGKGLFLVPTEANEFDIGLPTYEKRYHVQPGSGLTDLQFLIKQRLLSAPEDQGNYIVTAALAGQAPTGTALFTNNAYVVMPSLLAGVDNSISRQRLASLFRSLIKAPSGYPGQPTRRFNTTLQTYSGRSSRSIGRTGSMGRSVAARISFF